MRKILFIIFIAILGLCSCGKKNKKNNNDEPSKSAYVITFKDENDNVLDSKEYDVNTLPSYNYSVNDTEEWDYTFNGWSTSLNGSVVDIQRVSKDVTYYANVTKVKQKYLITFMNENGEKLEDVATEYGTKPNYQYNKQNSAEWKYVVKGWANEKDGDIISNMPNVTGIATYYAIVEKEKQQYTISFNSNGGNSLNPITNEYNTSVKEPTKPTKDGYAFVSWCTDVNLNNAVSWPINLTSNVTLYAKWNEKIDLTAYLNALVKATNQDPYSFIPDTMKPDYSKNYVTESEVTYNFNNFVNVSNIKYGGYGEQWQMVIDNIQQSEKFYTVLTLADTAISASVSAFNNWFDKNPSDTNKEITETGYYAKVNFSNNILTYTLRLKTGINVNLFGNVIPQIDMTYNVETKEKTVRVNLTDTNAMRYIIDDNHYIFGIEYGIDSVSRSAYCELTKKDDGSISGHIYEYITLKDKDTVKSCADFYIDNTYTSVVGNKASGIIGMDGYINELYKTSEGKLLGYKVMETKTVFGISGTYNTLWFNLNNISGINSVKVTEHTDSNKNKLNANNIYINGSANLFTPTMNKKLTVDTSRKYDIELRTQYRYGISNGELVCYKVELPMMFIQDDNYKDSNYSDFSSDIKSQNSITSSVTLSSTYLTKIRNDYDTLIPLFIQNKELVDSSTIKNWIGTVIK